MTGQTVTKIRFDHKQTATSVDVSALMINSKLCLSL